MFYFDAGQPEKKMGIKCSNTAEVFFSDVKVPVVGVGSVISLICVSRLM
jgi:hypothetical protein